MQFKTTGLRFTHGVATVESWPSTTDTSAPLSQATGNTTMSTNSTTLDINDNNSNIIDDATPVTNGGESNTACCDGEDSTGDQTIQLTFNNQKYEELSKDNTMRKLADAMRKTEKSKINNSNCIGVLRVRFRRTGGSKAKPTLFFVSFSGFLSKPTGGVSAPEQYSDVINHAMQKVSIHARLALPQDYFEILIDGKSLSSLSQSQRWKVAFEYVFRLLQLGSRMDTALRSQPDFNWLPKDDDLSGAISSELTEATKKLLERACWGHQIREMYHQNRADSILIQVAEFVAMFVRFHHVLPIEQLSGLKEHLKQVRKFQIWGMIHFDYNFSPEACKYLQILSSLLQAILHDGVPAEIATGAWKLMCDRVDALARLKPQSFQSRSEVVQWTRSVIDAVKQTEAVPVPKLVPESQLTDKGKLF